MQKQQANTIFFNIAKSTGRHLRTQVGHPRWPHAQRRWTAGKSEDAPTGAYTRTHIYTHAHTPPPSCDTSERLDWDSNAGGQLGHCRS